MELGDHLSPPPPPPPVKVCGAEKSRPRDRAEGQRRAVAGGGGQGRTARKAAWRKCPLPAISAETPLVSAHPGHLLPQGHPAWPGALRASPGSPVAPKTCPGKAASLFLSLQEQSKEPGFSASVPHLPSGPPGRCHTCLRPGARTRLDKPAHRVLLSRHILQLRGDGDALPPSVPVTLALCPPLRPRPARRSGVLPLPESGQGRGVTGGVASGRPTGSGGLCSVPSFVTGTLPPSGLGPSWAKHAQCGQRPVARLPLRGGVGRQRKETEVCNRPGEGQSQQ